LPSGRWIRGFWPDGIYTAPTDAALRSDIEMAKALGFNTIRKRVKVEPARWYYWADKLGILVWQDMPSAVSYVNLQPIVCNQPLDKRQFESELDLILPMFTA
jgi:beta-galactosidase/beta-glucuronidase